MNHIFDNMPHFSVGVLINIVIISIMLVIIEIIRQYDPSLIGAFAFVSGCFFFIQLLQYTYVQERMPSQSRSFLFHSIIGFFVCFLMAALFYFALEYTTIRKDYIIMGFATMNILLWIIYIYLYKFLKQS